MSHFDSRVAKPCSGGESGRGRRTLIALPWSCDGLRRGDHDRFDGLRLREHRRRHRRRPRRDPRAVVAAKPAGGPIRGDHQCCIDSADAPPSRPPWPRWPRPSGRLPSPPSPQPRWIPPPRRPPSGCSAPPPRRPRLHSANRIRWSAPVRHPMATRNRTARPDCLPAHRAAARGAATHRDPPADIGARRVDRFVEVVARRANAPEAARRLILGNRVGGGRSARLPTRPLSSDGSAVRAGVCHARTPGRSQARAPGLSMLLQGNLGLATLLTGEQERADEAFRNQMDWCRKLVARPFACEGLAGLARVALSRHGLKRAARLAGASEAHRYGQQRNPIDERLDAMFFTPARVRSGPETWDPDLREGATLSLAEAIASALETSSG